MSELVDRAKASLEGVTEGPWVISDQDDGTASVWSDGSIIFADESGYRGGFAALPDAEFVAAARQLVPELIAEVERLEGRIDVMAEQCRSVWVHAEKVIQERDEALRALKREQESHRETAEIMRRTRERAERLQAEIDAMKKQASVSCCTLSYKEGFSQCLSCQGKLR